MEQNHGIKKYLCEKHNEDLEALFGCIPCLIVREQAQWRIDNAERLRLEKLNSNTYKNQYALTINAGGISHNTEDSSQIVELFNRVCATKQLKNCHITYAYECYTRIDKKAPRTEDNLKRTFPHIHALIQSNTIIHTGTLKKTSKVQTDFHKIKGLEVAKWKNYLKKYMTHQDTMTLFEKTLIDTPHYGEIYT